MKYSFEVEEKIIKCIKCCFCMPKSAFDITCLINEAQVKAEYFKHKKPSNCPLSEVNTEGSEVTYTEPKNDARDDSESFCPICDNKVIDDFNYCPSCGERILFNGKDFYRVKPYKEGGEW